VSLQVLSLSLSSAFRGALNVYKSRVDLCYRRPLSFDLVFRNGEPRKHIPIPLFVLGAPHIQFLLFFLSAVRMPIPSLLPQRVCRFLLFVFSAALAHTNLYSLSSASCKCIPIRILCLRRASHPIPAHFPQHAHTCQFASLVLGAQADPFPLSSALRKRIPILYFFVLRNPLTYAPAEAKVNVGLGPERTRPDRYQRQDMVLLRTSSFP